MESGGRGAGHTEFTADCGDMNPQRLKSFMMRYVGEKISNTGLTESQAVFVLVLDAEKGMSLKDITESQGVHKSLTTRMIKYLISNGYAENVSESGKEYSVVLTPKGVEAKVVAQREFRSLWDLILEGLTDEEVELFNLVQHKIIERIKELSEQESNDL